LTLWFGRYQNQTQQWLGWWDSEGYSLLRGLAAYWRAEEQTQRDAIPQLLAMGLTVEQVAQALSLSVEKVRSHLAHH